MVTKGQISAEDFEKWKDECRASFKSEPNSANLINVFLKVLDETKKGDDIERANKRLLEFYENHLARLGELGCPHCGSAMEVYYTVHCFHCDESKPKIENNEGNFIMACKWLENKEEDFNYPELWDALCNMGVIEGNDRYMSLPTKGNSPEYNVNIRLFVKHFDIETTKWFVSW